MQATDRRIGCGQKLQLIVGGMSLVPIIMPTGRGCLRIHQLLRQPGHIRHLADTHQL
jgi:hypothetical protein